MQTILSSLKLISGSILILILSIPAESVAQGEAAVPFLLLGASPEGNGMGEIAATMPTDNPVALIANPAQLGLSSLSHLVQIGFYPSSATWHYEPVSPDLNYNASAFAAGVNSDRLKRFVSIPFGLSIGVAYSYVALDWAGFIGIPLSSTSDINVPGDHAHCWTFGLGVDYYIKVGFGLTTKSVESRLNAFSVQGQSRDAVAHVSAFDLGIIVEVPVIGAIDRFMARRPLLWNTIEPDLSLSIAYARRNLGDDKVVYIDPLQGDPLPRAAIAGVSATLGLLHWSDSDQLRVVAFSVAHEAEDLLAMRFPAILDSLGDVIAVPPWQYAPGAGAIRFIGNVLLGEGSTHATIRKGWQLEVCEMFAVRGGSVQSPGQLYSTTGYGVRLSGVFKLLERIAPSLASTAFVSFILDHVDARFDHATVGTSNPFNAENEVTFESLGLTVK